MLRHLPMWLFLGLLSAVGSGCCCVQGMPGGACGYGNCGPGPIASLASCRGACGDVYVDEWISEPPVVDNCGYDCGGCGNCGNCQPVRNLLRLLWGTPYIAACCPDACGPSCDGGCDGGYVADGYSHEAYYDGGHAHTGGGSGCNCGQSHSSYGSPSHAPILPHESMQPVPNSGSARPLEVAPEVVPTPAPTVEPSSARRLNPAARRMR